MSRVMSDMARKATEPAIIRQVANIRPEFVMATDAEVPTTVRYDLATLIDYRGTTYRRDPEHKHEPVNDVGAYALLWKIGRALWRGYSDGWDAVREMDATQTWVVETAGVAECSPVAVVDREGQVRWVAL